MANAKSLRVDPPNQPKVIWRRGLLQQMLVAAILATPSLYLLLKFPPLWRDSDGFFQVYERFNHITILHWPPLYCFAARIPIALGQVIASVVGGQGFVGFHFVPPQFTDLGIYLLVIMQHATLIGALFLICMTLTGSFFVRFLIALLFALNPAIYAFAHCVGSETMSNFFVLLTAVLGYRFVTERSVSTALAYAFAGSLSGAILSHHVNEMLMGLVPLAFLLTLVLDPFRSLGNPKGKRPLFARENVSRFFQSLFLGAVSILVANAIILGACAVTKTPFRSKLGAVFVWRLGYLSNITSASQERILKKVDTNLNDPAITFALDRVRELLIDKRPWDPDTMPKALVEWISARDHGNPKRILSEADQKLNQVALQFLLHGGAEFWAAVMHDFWISLNDSSSDICHEPFRTTDLLASWSTQARFQPVRHLSTFDPSLASYDSRWRLDPYLKIGKSIKLGYELLFVFLGASWIFVFRHEIGPQISLYVASLAFSGAAICFANCALTSMLPRFELPLLDLTLFGLAVIVATLLDKKMASGASEQFAGHGDGDRWNPGKHG
jgi:hypothetical protein